MRISRIACISMVAVVALASVSGNTEAGGLTLFAATEGCVEGSGVARTEPRELPSFSALEISGAVRVNIAAGKPQRLSISADDNIVPHVTTEVRERRLIVGLDEPICPKTEIVVDVALDRLESVSTSGLAVVRATGVTGGELRVSSTGSGSVAIAGEVEHLDARLAGAGELFANDLEARAVDVDIQGAGNAEVHATQKLHASIVGMGNVKYSGNPPQVDKQIVGLGEVAPR